MKYKAMVAALACLVCWTLMMFAGCATTAARTSSAETIAVVDSLRVGMKAADVRRIWGEPANIAAMEFGQNTSQAWNGVVFTYNAGRDPRFAYMKKSFRNRLVFALVASDTLLNHWSIEEREVSTFKAVKAPRY